MASQQSGAGHCESGTYWKKDDSGDNADCSGFKATQATPSTRK